MNAMDIEAPSIIPPEGHPIEAAHLNIANARDNCERASRRAAAAMQQFATAVRPYLREIILEIS
jgi:hypothetical protein